MNIFDQFANAREIDMFKKIIVSFIIVGLAYFYGIASYKYFFFPWPTIATSISAIRETGLFNPVDRPEPVQNIAPTVQRDKPPVDCSQLLGRVAVIISGGQSNAANSGDTPYSTHNSGVYDLSIIDGQCYVAKDPLHAFQADILTLRPSVWTRVADRLIDADLYDAVILVPTAVGGTSIKRWGPAGDLHHRLLAALEVIRKNGLVATHFLWHQGESDSGRADTRPMDQLQYTRHFTQIVQSLRNHGLQAPIFVSIATACANYGSDEVRSAQRNLPALLEGVFRGPNTDKLMGPLWRFDLCHMSSAGMDRHADMWLDAIRAPKR